MVFLMHRVELKERLKDSDRKRNNKRFLMHRVELKENREPAEVYHMV